MFTYNLHFVTIWS